MFRKLNHYSEVLSFHKAFWNITGQRIFTNASGANAIKAFHLGGKWKPKVSEVSQDWTQLYKPLDLTLPQCIRNSSCLVCWGTGGLLQWWRPVTPVSQSPCLCTVPPRTLTLSLATWVAPANRTSENGVPAKALWVLVQWGLLSWSMPASFKEKEIPAIQLKRPQEDNQVVPANNYH